MLDHIASAAAPMTQKATHLIRVAHNRLGGMITAGVARTGRAVEHLLS